MGSDKIFMFDNPAAGESAGIMSMIPALLQNKGLDPNLVAALMNGNRNQDAWANRGGTALPTILYPSFMSS